MRPNASESPAWARSTHAQTSAAASSGAGRLGHWVAGAAAPAWTGPSWTGTPAVGSPRGRRCASSPGPPECAHPAGAVLVVVVSAPARPPCGGGIRPELVGRPGRELPVGRWRPGTSLRLLRQVDVWAALSGPV